MKKLTEIGYSETVIVNLNIANSEVDKYLKKINELELEVQISQSFNISTLTLLQITCEGLEQMSDLYLALDYL